MGEQMGTKNAPNGQKSPITPVKWTQIFKSGQKESEGPFKQPPFKQKEITLPNGKVIENEK